MNTEALSEGRALHHRAGLRGLHRRSSTRCGRSWCGGACRSLRNTRRASISMASRSSACNVRPAAEPGRDQRAAGAAHRLELDAGERIYARAGIF